MSGTVDVEDGMVTLHHRAVAEYLLSEQGYTPVVGALPAAGQATRDAAVQCPTPVFALGDDDSASGPASPVIHVVDNCASVRDGRGTSTFSVRFDSFSWFISQKARNNSRGFDNDGHQP